MTKKLLENLVLENLLEETLENLLEKILENLVEKILDKNLVSRQIRLVEKIALTN